MFAISKIFTTFAPRHFFITSAKITICQHILHNIGVAFPVSYLHCSKKMSQLWEGCTFFLSKIRQFLNSFTYATSCKKSQPSEGKYLGGGGAFHQTKLHSFNS